MTRNPYHVISEAFERVDQYSRGDRRTGGGVVHNTYCPLSETFERIGRHLHGDAWTGGEADVLYCHFKEDDIAICSARKEKAVEPSRFPGGGEPGSAPEQIMSLFAHARDEQTEPINIIRLEVAAETSRKGKADDAFTNLLLIDNEAKARLRDLWGDAQLESLKRLRSGDTLSEAHFAILDELEKEYHAKKRRESVVFWITKHAWSGGGSDAVLTGYIFTPDDGKITPILAHCWDARSFRLSIYFNEATMDDQPWPADGVLVFLKSQLDAVLGSAPASAGVVDLKHGPSIVHPNRRGRRKGTGGYDSTDIPLTKKMNRLINTRKAANPWGAALLVVDDAEGAGSADNKIKRLVGKYVKKYGTSEGHSV